MSLYTEERNRRQPHVTGKVLLQIFAFCLGVALLVWFVAVRIIDILCGEAC